MSDTAKITITESPTRAQLDALEEEFLTSSYKEHFRSRVNSLVQLENLSQKCNRINEINLHIFGCMKATDEPTTDFWLEMYVKFRVLDGVILQAINQLDCLDESWSKFIDKESIDSWHKNLVHCLECTRENQKMALYCHNHGGETAVFKDGRSWLVHIAPQMGDHFAVRLGGAE